MTQNPYGPGPDQNPQNVPPHTSAPQQPGQEPAPGTSSPSGQQGPYATQGQPQQGAYAPQGQYQQAPAATGSNNLALNYWLSVFFTIISAAIFYFTEKDKDPRAFQFHKANLLFSGARFGIIFVLNILTFNMYSPFISLTYWAVVLGLFGLHIYAALNVEKKFKSGSNESPFPVWPPLS